MNRNLSALTLFLIASALLPSCGNSAKQAQPNPAAAAVPVEVSQVSQETVTGTDSYPGTVVALNEVELRAEVGGYITAIYIKDGQKVSKGQKLYEIDRTKYQAAYSSALSNVKITEANLDKVSKDLERYNRLAQQDAIAKQRVDYAQTDVNNARAQLESSNANLSSVANDLKHSVITAPFSGTIGISQVKLGALVAAGSTLLNTLSSEDPIAVDFAVSSEDIQRFIKLQDHPASLKDSVFTITLGGQQRFVAPGKIAAIDRAVDPQTGTITVRVSFPNPGGMLRSGMNCNLEVRNQDSGEKITIPYKSVTEQMSEFFVYVVGDSSKVSQRKVQLGMRVNNKVVVRDGLKAGETIVSDGVQNLHEGSVITRGNPDQAPQASKK